MAHIPAGIKIDQTSAYLLNAGFKMIHQGKVRDTFEIPQRGLLSVASDRVSIFDFVLNARVPFKGACLTALTHFWMTEILTSLQNHLIPSNINPCFNAAYDIRQTILPELNIGNCLLTADLRGFMDPAELIFRKCFGGSVYKNYLETGMAAGIKMEPGLEKWTELEKALFTPSTKEEVGHDLNITQEQYYAMTGKKGEEFIVKLSEAYETVLNHAAAKGIMILDTKLEGSSKLGVLADECFTPDSSRFCMRDEYERAMAEHADPPFKEKQIIRN